MKPQHTKGEWARNIKPASKYSTIYAGRNTHVAYLATQGLADEEIEANCNLIAAAPKLLEALQSIVVAYQQHFDVMPPAWKPFDDIAKEAISEAIGDLF